MVPVKFLWWFANAFSIVLTKAYEKGLMIAVVPFTSKV